MLVETNGRGWLRPFLTVWVGQAVSQFGNAVVQFATIWWLAALTNSATMLTYASIVSALPYIILAPWAGALVDRWDRRIVMIISDGSIGLFSAGLAVLFMLHVAIPWHLFLVLFLRSVGGVFLWPAMAASVPLMVPKDHLGRIAGMNQTLLGVMQIVAPPAAAFLLLLLPMQDILLVDACTAALGILPLFFITIPQPASIAQIGDVKSKFGSLQQDVRAGIRYVWRWPGLRTVLVLGGLVYFIMSPTVSLGPILVRGFFKLGAKELGIMQAAMGIGIVLGGLILSVWGGTKKKVYTIAGGVLGIGVGTTLIGLTPPWFFYLAVGGAFLSGAMVAAANAPLTAIIQSCVDPRIQGRVLTVFNSMISVISPLGLAIAGPLSDLFGVHIWYLVAGIACLVMGILAFFLRSVRNLEEEGLRHMEAMARIDFVPVERAGEKAEDDI
jgi:DHA3 family macrolide efflux protein-like MFS transporter